MYCDNGWFFFPFISDCYPGPIYLFCIQNRSSGQPSITFVFHLYFFSENGGMKFDEYNELQGCGIYSSINMYGCYEMSMILIVMMIVQALIIAYTGQSNNLHIMAGIFS